jgi:hypothetical protein
MIRKTVVTMAVALTLTAQASATSSPPKKAAAPPAAGATKDQRLEPKAIELLKAMSARLAAARTMSFTAVVTDESPSRIGPALAYTTTSDVTLQRPDKLRIITPGDGPATEFYYDGKTMTAYAPAENLVAIADAPPTIDGALKAAYESAAIYYPFTDVMVADPYGDIAPGLTRAFVIGQSHVVGGTTTDMVAIVDADVFAQLWIGADDKLPRRIRAVFAKDPSRLRHQVEFSNWRLDGDVPADSFASSRAANATRIQFKRPDPPAGATAQGTPKAAAPAAKK